jgi:hypothetical protein
LSIPRTTLRAADAYRYAVFILRKDIVMSIIVVRRRALQICALQLVLMLYSCSESSTPESDWENIGVHQVIVHQIDVVDTITALDTLAVIIDGYTNPDGRLTLSSIEADRVPAEVSLTIWAEVERWIGTGIMPPFDTSIRCTYEAIPPFDEGSFYIIIEQPDSSQLVDSVQIVN